jgi:hypothetical protein
VVAKTQEMQRWSTKKNVVAAVVMTHNQSVDLCPLINLEYICLIVATQFYNAPTIDRK